MSTNIQAQITNNKNNVRIAGPVLGKQSIGTYAQFSKKEIYIIVQMYKHGLLHQLSCEGKVFDIGKVSENDIELMFAEPPADIITTIRTDDTIICTATTLKGVQCSKPATDSDKLCTAHRKKKNAGE